MTTDIDAYFNNIRAQVKRIPRDIALAVAEEVFQAVVQKTRQDSGQAALNWHFEPYEGSAPQMMDQEMLWGFGSTPPVTPASYKHTRGRDSEQVFVYQFEYLTQQLALAPEHIDGVYIYNPISPGFPAFEPGSDEFYAQNALGSIDIEAITLAALAQVEGRHNA